MGIIKKQAIKGSIWSYVGILLGFVNIGILTQKFFTTEQVGLTQVLLSISSIFSQIGVLGMGNVTSRLFPYFRDKSKKHNGFLGLILSICFIGFLVMCFVVHSFEPFFVNSNIQKSSLLQENFGFVYPMIFFLLSFTILDAYNRMLYNAVLGTFSKEFLLRVANTISILLFILGKVSFEGYLLLYVFSQAIPALVETIYLLIKGELSLRIDLKFIKPELKKEIFDVALFGIIASLSGMVIQNVDRIMLNRYASLDSAGVYSVTFYFATLILVSQRAVSNISTTIISESWKNNDIANISNIYVKSSINQFVVGLLIFVGIWGNIDNVFLLLKPEYAAGKWVIFFIGLTNLITVLSGVAVYILSTSKYYRYHMWLMVYLIALVIVTNLIFIPLFGLSGAAIASLISILLYTTAICVFIYKKFRIQPLRFKHVSILLAGAIAYFVSTFMPHISNFIIDIAVRSCLITAVYGVFILLFHSSEDIDEMFNFILVRLKIKH